MQVQKYKPQESFIKSRVSNYWEGLNFLFTWGQEQAICTDGPVQVFCPSRNPPPLSFLMEVFQQLLEREKDVPGLDKKQGKKEPKMESLRRQTVQEDFQKLKESKEKMWQHRTCLLGYLTVVLSALLPSAIPPSESRTQGRAGALSGGNGAIHPQTASNDFSEIGCT